MEQAGTTNMSTGQFIYLSRNSKLARMFQESPAPARPATRQVTGTPALSQASPQLRAAATACPKLQAVANPGLELTRPLASALMREQAAMRCRARGVLLDNEYVRDICAAGNHQHCPFLKD